MSDERTIWKFGIKIDDEVTLLMPVGAEILTCQMQNGFPYLWAIVTPGATEPRRFRFYGTGHPVHHDPGKYINTIQMADLVFHLFEV